MEPQAVEIRRTRPKTSKACCEFQIKKMPPKSAVRYPNCEKKHEINVYIFYIQMQIYPIFIRNIVETPFKIKTLSIFTIYICNFNDLLIVFVP